MMDQNLREKLIELGVESLADALIELAVQDDVAMEVIERMVATPEDRIKKFKRKVTGLKRTRSFYNWFKARELANKMEATLLELKDIVIDPCLGAELVISFFETDRAIFGCADDSNGVIGTIYRIDARSLFLDYAKKCNNKKKLLKRIVKFYADDPFSVRLIIINCAAQYLDEKEIRELISIFQAKAEDQVDEDSAEMFNHAIKSLVRQIKDAQLFEEIHTSNKEELPLYSCVEISEVYLESGNAAKALEWLKRIPDDETFMLDKRYDLLFDIYGILGDSEKQLETAWKIFHRCRSKEAFESLLQIIGPEKSESIVDEEIEIIFRGKDFRFSDVDFLICQNRSESAAQYIVERREIIPGHVYEWLRPMAKTMESMKQPLAVSVIYRVLLDSILRDARTKAYGHGARYLKALDDLSFQISNWQGIRDHESYKTDLLEKHGRKRSFWSKYD